MKWIPFFGKIELETKLMRIRIVFPQEMILIQPGGPGLTVHDHSSVPRKPSSHVPISLVHPGQKCESCAPDMQKWGEIFRRGNLQP
jgi:hypothetical protein